MSKEYKEAFLEEIGTIDWSFVVGDLAYRFQNRKVVVTFCQLQLGASGIRCSNLEAVEE